VWRLCRDQKLWSTTTRKGRRGSGKRPGPAVHDDLAAAELHRRTSRPGLADRHRAPRGAPEPCGGERTPPPVRRSGRAEAEGSLNPGMGARAEAALTTTGRIGTARRSGPGKRDRKAYVRNQRLNAPQESQRLEPGGSGPHSSAHPPGNGWGTPRLGDVADREATVNACGVAVAMLQGHSWTPTLSKGSRVNVGTIPAVPFPVSSLLAGGKVRRRPMLSGWGGGPVVVRGRESRSHGEGVQHDRSIHAERGGRW